VADDGFQLTSSLEKIPDHDDLKQADHTENQVIKRIEHMNYFKTTVLLAAMTGLFLAVGYLMAGEIGMGLAFVVAIAMNVYSFWNSDKMVLRMHGAQEVDAETAPEYYEIVRQLAENADLPMPQVYIMNNSQPNAFATGRNPENSAVAASTGLLEVLSPEEVAGVMAHELAHIKNRDTLIMTITATFAGAISMIANFALFFRSGRNGIGIIGTIALMILAPLGASIVQMTISRTREYAADKLGAEICGRPLWLASALAKIAGGGRQIENVAAERNPATAHMFIVNPLSGKNMDNLFSTHPNTENRITALQELARQWQMDDTPTDGPWAQQTDNSPDVTRRGPWG